MFYGNWQDETIPTNTLFHKGTKFSPVPIKGEHSGPFTDAQADTRHAPMASRNEIYE